MRHVPVTFRRFCRAILPAIAMRHAATRRNTATARGQGAIGGECEFFVTTQRIAHRCRQRVIPYGVRSAIAVGNAAETRRRFLRGGAGARSARARRRGWGWPRRDRPPGRAKNANRPQPERVTRPQFEPRRAARHPTAGARQSGRFPRQVFRIFSVRGSGGKAKALDLLATPTGFEPVLPP